MTSTALTIPASLDGWQAPDWRRLWMSIWNKNRRWRSLALVPAGPGVPHDTFLKAAAALAHTGTLCTRIPIHVADAANIPADQHEVFSSAMHEHLHDGELMLLALAALSENAISLPLAKAADSALLCIVQNEMGSAEAKRTVKHVGAPHFVGSAIFRIPPELMHKPGKKPSGPRKSVPPRKSSPPSER